MFSAPSGGGKSTVIQEVMRQKVNEYQYSLSATTRAPRGNEVDGTDYFFLTRDEFFKRRDANEFLEWAVVHGNYYATPRKAIEKSIADKQIILLDIDVQGGIEVKKQLGDEAFLIFLAPPSMQSLETRLRNRKTDSDEIIKGRLSAAFDEMKYAKEYDSIIINDKLEDTIKQVLSEIDKKINEL